MQTTTTLTLMQIADSAFPIGGFAHSFGLETAVTEQYLTPSNLSGYIADLMQTVGRRVGWDGVHLMRLCPIHLHGSRSTKPSQP